MPHKNDIEAIDDLDHVAGGAPTIPTLWNAAVDGYAAGSRLGGFAGALYGGIAGYEVTAPFNAGDKGVIPGAAIGMNIGQQIGGPVGMVRGVVDAFRSK